MVGDFQFDIAIYGLFSKNLSTSGATGQSKFRTEPNDRGPKKTKMHAPPLLQLSHRTEALGIGGAASFRRRTPTRAPLPDPPPPVSPSHPIPSGRARPTDDWAAARASLTSPRPARPGSARPSPAGVGCQGDCVAPSRRRERLLAHCAESTPGGGPARPARLSERGRRPAARAAPAGPTGAGESQKVP